LAINIWNQSKSREPTLFTDCDFQVHRAFLVLPAEDVDV
jgi:hypothetical protein